MAHIEILPARRTPRKHVMVIQSRPLKREEILRLAVQARLMIEEGDTFCLNDIAGDKELLVFARLLETRLNQSLGGVLIGNE